MSPTPDQMRLAALWLLNNEGDGEELESCQRVAAWLEKQADAKEQRHICRAAKVPVAALRARLSTS